MDAGAGRNNFLTRLIVHFPDCISEGTRGVDDALCPDCELLSFFAVSFLHFVFYPCATEFPISILDETSNFDVVDHCGAV